MASVAIKIIEAFVGMLLLIVVIFFGYKIAMGKFGKTGRKNSIIDGVKSYLGGITQDFDPSKNKYSKPMFKSPSTIKTYIETGKGKESIFDDDLGLKVKDIIKYDPNGCTLSNQNIINDSCETDFYCSGSAIDDNGQLSEYKIYDKTTNDPLSPSGKCNDSNDNDTFKDGTYSLGSGESNTCHVYSSSDGTGYYMRCGKYSSSTPPDELEIKKNSTGVFGYSIQDKTTKNYCYVGKDNHISCNTSGVSKKSKFSITQSANDKSTWSIGIEGAKCGFSQIPDDDNYYINCPKDDLADTAKFTFNPINLPNGDYQICDDSGKHCLYYSSTINDLLTGTKPYSTVFRWNGDSKTFAVYYIKDGRYYHHAGYLGINTNGSFKLDTTAKTKFANIKSGDGYKLQQVENGKWCQIKENSYVGPKIPINATMESKCNVNDKDSALTLKFEDDQTKFDKVFPEDKDITIYRLHKDFGYHDLNSRKLYVKPHNLLDNQYLMVDGKDKWKNSTCSIKDDYHLSCKFDTSDPETYTDDGNGNKIWKITKGIKTWTGYLGEDYDQEDYSQEYTLLHLILENGPGVADRPCEPVKTKYNTLWNDYDTHWTPKCLKRYNDKGTGHFLYYKQDT